MGGWPAGDIRFYNFHPPGEVRLFITPGAAVKRWDSSVLVFDVRIGDAILRKYSFTEHWFEVHCTFDLDGRLRPEPGPVNWAFNCDMCTPAVVRDMAVYNVDLSLDVLVAPDGVTFALTDEDDFDEARTKGWLTFDELAGARCGADELIGIIRGGGLRPFLESILPFDSVVDSTPQRPPRILTIDDVPEFRFTERLLGRPAALTRTAERLRGQPDVPDEERQAVLEAIDAANAERAGELSNRSAGDR